VPNVVTAWMVPVWDQEIQHVMRGWKVPRYGVNLEPIARYTAQEVWKNRQIRPNSLVAEPLSLWTTDVRYYGIEEARGELQALLTFSAKRPGRINALAVWFAAILSDRVTLTNAPDGAATHWGQYLFPLDETIRVQLGDEIVVHFTCAPAGQGFCHNTWRVQAADGPAESHDSRIAFQ